MPSLPDLPTELLMEIAKYYPPRYGHDIDDIIHRVRPQYLGCNPLRALSQTWRTLRSVFLPAAWARISSIRTSDKSLEGVMRGIQRTAYVVPHIQFLSVTLGECNMDYWQPIAQFIRVLRVLPNLRTLTFFGIQPDMVSIFIASCEDFVFPSITTLALPDELAPILHCFPNVQTLTSAPNKLPRRYNQYNYYYSFDVDTYTGGGWAFFEAGGSRFEHVHTFNNLNLWPSTLKALRKAIPHLQRLSVWRNLESVSTDLIVQAMRSLEGMDNLSEFRVRHKEGTSLRPWCDPQKHLDTIIEAGKRVLQTSKAAGRKEFHVVHLIQSYHDAEKETHFILEGGEWRTTVAYTVR